MDNTKELNLIKLAEERAKALTKAASKLKLILSALEELEDGASVSLRLDCGKGAEMNVDGALNREATTKHFKSILEEAARRQFVTLAKVYGGADTPEKIKTELVMEIPERKAANGIIYPINPTFANILVRDET